MNKVASIFFHLYQIIFCFDFYKNIKIKKFGFYVVKNSKLINVNGTMNINDYVYINGKGGIDFGNNVILSAGAKIISTGLEIDDVGFKNKHINKKIVIGDNVQIGAGAIILAGVNICDNVIIGAGSVVTKNVVEAGVYVGSPIRCIKRFDI